MNKKHILTAKDFIWGQNDPRTTRGLKEEFNSLGNAFISKGLFAGQWSKQWSRTSHVTLSKKNLFSFSPQNVQLFLLVMIMYLFDFDCKRQQSMNMHLNARLKTTSSSLSRPKGKTYFYYYYPYINRKFGWSCRQWWIEKCYWTHSP